MDESKEQPSLEKVLLLLLWCWIYALMLMVRRTAGNISIWRKGMLDAFSNRICQERSTIVIFQAHVRYDCPVPSAGVFWYGKVVFSIGKQNVGQLPDKVPSVGQSITMYGVESALTDQLSL